MTWLLRSSYIAPALLWQLADGFPFSLILINDAVWVGQCLCCQCLLFPRWDALVILVILCGFSGCILSVSLLKYVVYSLFTFLSFNTSQILICSFSLLAFSGASLVYQNKRQLQYLVFDRSEQRGQVTSTVFFWLCDFYQTHDDI